MPKDPIDVLPAIPAPLLPEELLLGVDKRVPTARLEQVPVTVKTVVVIDPVQEE